jgi:hypothetical protein
LNEGIQGRKPAPAHSTAQHTDTVSGTIVPECLLQNSFVQLGLYAFRSSWACLHVCQLRDL